MKEHWFRAIIPTTGVVLEDRSVKKLYKAVIHELYYDGFTVQGHYDETVFITDAPGYERHKPFPAIYATIRALYISDLDWLLIYVNGKIVRFIG